MHILLHVHVHCSTIHVGLILLKISKLGVILTVHISVSSCKAMLLWLSWRLLASEHDELGLWRDRHTQEMSMRIMSVQENWNKIRVHTCSGYLPTPILVAKSCDGAITNDSSVVNENICSMWTNIGLLLSLTHSLTYSLMHTLTHSTKIVNSSLDHLVSIFNRL